MLLRLLRNIFSNFLSLFASIQTAFIILFFRNWFRILSHADQMLGSSLISLVMAPDLYSGRNRIRLLGHKVKPAFLVVYLWMNTLLTSFQGTRMHPHLKKKFKIIINVGNVKKWFLYLQYSLIVEYKDLGDLNLPLNHTHRYTIDAVIERGSNPLFS